MRVWRPNRMKCCERLPLMQQQRTNGGRDSPLVTVHNLWSLPCNLSGRASGWSGNIGTGLGVGAFRSDLLPQRPSVVHNATDESSGCCCFRSVQTDVRVREGLGPSDPDYPPTPPPPPHLRLPWNGSSSPVVAGPLGHTCTRPRPPPRALRVTFLSIAFGKTCRIASLPRRFSDFPSFFSAGNGNPSVAAS